MDVDLDQLFRKGSKAQKAARILMDGRPHSRQELAEKAKVSPTTIPRVIGILKDAGVRLDTTMGDNGRTAVYQMKGAPSAGKSLNAKSVARYVPEKDPLTLSVENLGVEQGRVTIRFVGAGMLWYCTFPPDVTVDGIGLHDEYPLIGVQFYESGDIVMRLGGGFGADVILNDRRPVNA